MKLLIRDYLASLKEREELDAILPDLLSELGYTVYSRPGRGTVQFGVDIAAVGKDESGERKVFLFSVKQGDLTRHDWDNGTPQALRPSLNEIRDVYIKRRIPPRYRHLKIEICLCFGGDVQEQVRDALTGYTTENTTPQVSYSEWNGDRLAEMMLSGILREKFLPSDMRSSFQKAVAMVDEPDIAYLHFSRLARALLAAAEKSSKARLRAARQLNICLWILFVWARQADNLEAPYRASLLSLLVLWQLIRPTLESRKRDKSDLGVVLAELIQLHMRIALLLVGGRIVPHVKTRFGLSMAIRSRSSLDVNLALFQMLGRVGLTGLWLHWATERTTSDEGMKGREGVVELAEAGLDLIASNPILLLPVSDSQGTDVAIFLQLLLVSGIGGERIAPWLNEMADRLSFTTRAGGRYPAVFTDYRELSGHPRSQADAYFEEATAGSTLVPLLVAWLEGLGEARGVTQLAELASEKLKHCTFQLWTPDASSEDHIYLGDEPHGRALTDLPVPQGGVAVLQAIRMAVTASTPLSDLSAVSYGRWPIILTACFHHRLPVPPAFWIDALVAPQNPPEASLGSDSQVGAQ